nr:unnamed protein product [Callosobruchus chinensis]
MDVYYAYVYSAVSYCITVCGQSSELNRVFVMQKRIIRFYFSIPFRKTCRYVFRSEYILTVPCIYIIYKLLWYTFQSKCSYLKHRDIRHYSTRNRENVMINKLHHTFFRKSPVHAGCSLFNMLPAEIRNSRDANIFKIKIRNC